VVNKKFLKSRFLGASKPFLGDRYIHVTVRHMLRGRCLSCLSVTLVYCGQTVGWIRMPLGTEVGLGPGDIVLAHSHRNRAQQPSNFRFTLLWHGRPSRQLLGSCYIIPIDLALVLHFIVYNLLVTV